MSDPGAAREPKTAWQLLKPDFRWLRSGVQWKSIVLAAVMVGVVAAIFIAVGGINVYADRPDGWLARHFLHFVFKRSTASRAESVVAPPDLAAPTRVRLGAQQFAMVCSNCHGGPGVGQSVIALSLSPRPQNLPKVVGQFTDAELYLIVKHGVKYSAMPSWPTQVRSDEIWTMVAFLRQLPTMDATTYRALTTLPAQTETSAPAADAAAETALRPANAERNTPPEDEFLYAAPAIGFFDPTVHANPTATCARCHGADGSGAATSGEAPNLTIQDAAYLRASLQAFTSGARKSGYMQNVAAQLSSAQIAALSDYYAGLAVKTVPSPQADSALAKRGEKIATEGIRERAIPACANCHESAGAAVIRAPHIAGQSATFLRRQLGDLRLDGRGSTVAWNPMPAEAHDLSDDDIAALAAFYSGLKPVKGADAAQLAQLPHAMPPPGDIGAAKATFDNQCVKCHGNGGVGDSKGLVPDLTLQSTPYVAQTLYSFRKRTRKNEKMLEIIDRLSYDEMTSLADYVNSLAPQKALAPVDAAAAARGAAIATNGLAAHNVPACLSCHDAKSTGALPLIPRLQGQSVVYLNKRLDDFSKEQHVDLTALNPMPTIAGQLTDQERADLAAYFAAAAPVDKTAAQR